MNPCETNICIAIIAKHNIFFIEFIVAVDPNREAIQCSSHSRRSLKLCSDQVIVENIFMTLDVELGLNFFEALESLSGFPIKIQSNYT